MSNELPPLPEPTVRELYATSHNTDSVRKGFEMGGYIKRPAYFTADQMEDYARAAVAAEREACAALADKFANRAWNESRSAAWSDEFELLSQEIMDRATMETHASST